MIRQFAIAVLLCLLPATAFGHGGGSHGGFLSEWTFDPLVIVCLTISASVYFAGLYRLWGHSELGSGISIRSAGYFLAGWLSLVIALLSPIHAWGEELFAMHMTQHEILMLVSAPLIVLGRPFVASMWSLPKAGRTAIGKFVNSSTVSAIRSLFGNSAFAWAIHAAALWVWHIPSLFQATLTSDFVHMLQHLSFFGSAVLFWWAIVNSERGAMSYGAGILYLFTTSLHSGVLGAFLTFTRKAWYPAYAQTGGEWGFTPIEDQQLGGLIMWVPAGIVYIAAALVMFSGWLRETEKRTLAREQTRLQTAG